MKPWSLTLRLFVVGAVLVAGFGWFALRQVLEEVKPAVRQSTEETLVDTANLLAELVASDLRAGTLAQGGLASVMASYGRAASGRGYLGHPQGWRHAPDLHHRRQRQGAAGFHRPRCGQGLFALE